MAQWVSSGAPPLGPGLTSSDRSEGGWEFVFSKAPQVIFKHCQDWESKSISSTISTAPLHLRPTDGFVILELLER